MIESLRKVTINVHPKQKRMKNQINLRSRLPSDTPLAFLAVFFGLAALFCLSDSRAANITFSPPATCAGDTDVFNLGGGYAYSWSAAQTVNGVTFTPLTGTIGGGNLSLSGFNAVNASAFTTTVAPFANLSPAYRGVLVGAVFYNVANSGLGTVTLNNLLPGGKYVMQVWVGDPRAGATTNRAEWIYDGFGGATNLLVFNTTRVNGGLGQYIIGKFTADSSSQSFILDSSSPPVTNFIVQMNAIQVRDVTAVWSGTTSGNWADSDNSSANFTGLSFQGLKGIGQTEVYFADTDGTGTSAPATTSVAIGAGGVSGVNVTFQNNALTYTVSCADANGITGAQSVTLSGTNTVTFTGAHTYTGSTVLRPGSHLVLAGSGSIAGSTLISLGAGSTLDATTPGLTLGSASTLSGNGTVKGNVSAPSGSSIIPGGVGTVGTLAFNNNLTLNGQAFTLDLGITPGGNDQITVGGTLTLNANSVITLNQTGPLLVNGTYTLFTFASKVGAGNFSLNTAYPGITLNTTASNVTLTVTGSPLFGTVATWTNLLGGSWTDSANWLGGVIATNVDNIADFSTLDITAARTVTVNSPNLNIGHLIFGDAVQNANWTLSTGTNVLAVSSGSPSIIVSSGQNTTISASLQGTQGFAKLGAGTLTLSGANRFTNGVRVNGGTLITASTGALGTTTDPTVSSLTLSNATWQDNIAATYTNNLVLAGTSNTISFGAQVTLNHVGSWSGAGTLVLNSPAVTALTQRGQMTNFSGTIIVNAAGGTGSGGGLFMGQNDDVTGISGGTNIAFQFNGSGRYFLYNGAIPATCYMGELSSDASPVIYTKYNRPGDVNLQVGFLNTSSTFAGSLRDINTPGVNTTKLILDKFGFGTLTLSGANTYTGPTTVRAGTLEVSGSLANTPVTVLSGATFLLSGTVASSSINVASGGRFVVSGGSPGSAAIAVDGFMDVSAFGGFYSPSGGSLSGSGLVDGGVLWGSATLNPGPVGAAGTLTITNGNLAVFGGTLAFDLSNQTNGANDLLVVKGNLDLSGFATVNINQYLGTLQGGTYPLIQFTGTFSGDVANLTLTGAGPLDTLVLNPNGQQIDLIVSPTPTVVWTGDGAANLWDIATSTNWLLGMVPSTFTNGWIASFNNVGGTNPVVNIPATVTPGSVTVSGASNYTFTGAGDISGGASIVKSGTGKLTLLNANTFTGSTLINDGTVQLGDGATLNGSVAGNIANSGVLVFANPIDQTYAGVLSGAGTFTKQGVGNLTLTGNSAITGPTIISAGAITLGDGFTAPGSYGSGVITNNSTLAINQSAAYTLTNVITGTGGVANLTAFRVDLSGSIGGAISLTNEASAGRLYLNASNTYTGGTFIKGGIVEVVNGNSLGRGPVIIDDFGTGSLNFSPANGATIVVTNNITLPNATTTQFRQDTPNPTAETMVRLTGLISGGAAGLVTPVAGNAGTANTLVLSLENPGNTFTTTLGVSLGVLAFRSDGALGNATNGLRSSTPNVLAGGITTDISHQGLRFDANNITLNANRTIELVNNFEFIDVQSFNGTIAGPVTGTGTLRKSGSGTLTLDGQGSLTGATIISNGTLVINNLWSGSSVTAATGTTLAGSGSITAPVTIASGATLAPGVSGIGTLTVNGSLSLAGASVMDVDADSVTSDQVAGVSTLNYGGMLTVNLSGTPAAGQSYQLFSATTYNGDFAALSLPALGSGLTWNWTPINGTLSIVQSVATNPTNLTAVVNGSNIDLSWPASHTGWRLEVQTNSLGVGIATNWSTWPGSAATNAVSVPIDPANPTVFYRLAYP